MRYASAAGLSLDQARLALARQRHAQAIARLNRKMEASRMITAFSPYPGFDPIDGADDRVSLSPDNPCAPGAVDCQPTRDEGDTNVND